MEFSGWISILLLLLSSGSSLVRIRAVLICPSPSENCDCTDAYVGDVMCSGMTTIPQNLPTTTTFLNLDSNKIGPSLLVSQMDSLSNLTLEHLYLSGTGLEAIEPRCFSQQANLEVLDLSRNNLESLDENTFEGLVQLSTLFLTMTALREISPALFVNTPSLTYLDLSGNELITITTEFSPLSNLEILLMSSNKIKSLDPNAFQNQAPLRRLDLFDNKLTNPSESWFEELIQNNGTLKLDITGKANPWECCEQTLGYRVFYDSVPVDYASIAQLNIECASPIQFQGHRIGNITTSQLRDVPCEQTTAGVSTNGIATTTPSSHSQQSTTKLGTHNTSSTRTRGDMLQDITTPSPKINASHEVTSSEGEAPALRREEKVTGDVFIEPENFMRHLTDVQLVLIFVLVAVFTSFVTAAVVFKYNTRKNKKSLDSFIQDLPSSKYIDSDDEDALTTRTYRQDVAVYGSAGQIIDRHKSGQMNTSPDDTSSEGSGRYTQVQKRKPPPYIPPDSPDESGGAEEEEGSENKQVNNNSSSVAMRQRSCAFSHAHEGDTSDDDIWDVNNVKRH